MLVPLTTPGAFRAREAFRQDNPRIVPVPSLRLQCDLTGGPDPQLVEAQRQVGGVLIDAICTGPHQLRVVLAYALSLFGGVEKQRGTRQKGRGWDI